MLLYTCTITHAVCFVNIEQDYGDQLGCNGGIQIGTAKPLD